MAPMTFEWKATARPAPTVRRRDLPDRLTASRVVLRERHAVATEHSSTCASHFFANGLTPPP
jgi:hypothetical protein